MAFFLPPGLVHCSVLRWYEKAIRQVIQPDRPGQLHVLHPDPYSARSPHSSRNSCSDETKSRHIVCQTKGLFESQKDLCFRLSRDPSGKLGESG